MLVMIGLFGMAHAEAIPDKGTIEKIEQKVLRQALQLLISPRFLAEH